MNRLVVLGAATVGGLIVFKCLSSERRHRITTAVKQRMMKHMENVMAGLPEEAPPKLIMSILPKLRAQNDQIIALLQQQNELLRTRHQTVQ